MKNLFLILFIATVYAYPWPVSPFNNAHWVTSVFFEPRSSSITGQSYRPHTGIDIDKSGTNTNVFPVASGEVVAIYTEGTDQWCVIIDDGWYYYTYVHLDNINVSVYDNVYISSTVIGQINTDGAHTHLHFVDGLWNTEGGSWYPSHPYIVDAYNPLNWIEPSDNGLTESDPTISLSHCKIVRNGTLEEYNEYNSIPPGEDIDIIVRAWGNASTWNMGIGSIVVEIYDVDYPYYPDETFDAIEFMYDDVITDDGYGNYEPDPDMVFSLWGSNSFIDYFSTNYKAGENIYDDYFSFPNGSDNEFTIDITVEDQFENDSYQNQALSMQTAIEGDLTGDVIINVLDIVILVDNILNSNATYYESWAGDYTGNSQVDVLDVVAIINLILYSSTNEYPDGTVFITKTTKQQSTPPYLMEVNMANETAVQGLQMTIKLDTGYKAVAVDSARYASDNNMTLAYNISSDSTEVRYLYYGLEGEYFPKDSSGVILEIGMIYNGSSRSFSIGGGGDILEMIFSDTEAEVLDCENVDNQEYNRIVNELRSGANTSTPTSFALHPAFPNPFNPVTTISYELPEPGQMEIMIFNLAGREITRLVDTVKDAGYHSVRWDATQFASGTYFIKMTSGKFTQTQKITFVK